jgi:hypothetical protein
MDFSVPIYRRSFTDIWTAATSTTALPTLINAGYERLSVNLVMLQMCFNDNST